jgi:diacylglycerol kinase
MLSSQPNARIHLAAAMVAILAGFFFRISSLEWVAIVLCIALVFALEAVNTALEFLTDLVSPDFHPLAGKAKDVAAAAVLVAALGAAAAGLIIFLPKILGLLG